MVRVNNKRPSADEAEDVYEARRRAAERRVTPTRTGKSSTEQEGESGSPAASFSSDKENRSVTEKSTTTASNAAAAGASSGARRRALAERMSASGGSTPARQDESGQDGEEGHDESVLDTRVYDPEQDMGTRRSTRKNVRDLTRELLDSRNEFLARESTGLKDSILKANAFFDTVKQTSDATLDSRFLVSAGDTAARRAVRMNFGGAARGVDVGEFVLKCRSFMNRGPRDEELSSYPRSIQPSLRSRPGHSQIQDGTSDDEGAAAAADPHDDGDELNWSWLGLKGCAPFAARPPTPNFLLGPLAVQKKARAQTQRTQRERPRDPADATRPDELRAGDGAQGDGANLTALCRRIYKKLFAYQRDTKVDLEAWAARWCGDGAADAAAAFDPSRIPDAVMAAQLEERHLCSDGGVCLFHFAFNPQSFGQTVENLFYISFLIRDGKAGLGQSPEGFPSLHPTDPTDPDAARSKKVARRQAVFHLDFETWKEACRDFKVEQCVIGHRNEDGTAQIGENGWYA